jgi:tetratricopeptide (TPR) repeat protein
MCVAGRYERAEGFALKEIETLAAKKGDDAKLAGTLRVNLVAILAHAGERRQAQRLYEKFLAEDPENFELLKTCQTVYRGDDAEDSDKVTELLGRAIQLKPSDPWACNNLAYTWVDRGVKLDEAEPLLRRALALKAAPSIQDSMAWLKYKQGDFSAALNLILRAHNSDDGDHPVMYDHMGDIYWRLGRKAEGIEMWLEAADLAAAEAREFGDRLDEDTRRVADHAAEKAKAAQQGRTPGVAPLGQGVQP